MNIIKKDSLYMKQDNSKRGNKIMELNDAIKNRRSIRKYKNIDIPNNIIEDLIASARLAPSAKNRQPWEFMIVKGKTKNSVKAGRLCYHLPERRWLLWNMCT